VKRYEKCLVGEINERDNVEERGFEGSIMERLVLNK